MLLTEELKNIELEEELLCEEMAIINPQFCKNRTIQAEVEQRNEGPIPHLHIYKLV